MPHRAIEWHEELVTADTEFPVTLAQLIDHLGVAAGPDDDRLNMYLSALTRWAESAVRGGVAFMPQTWDYVAEKFPPGSAVLELPRPPLASITSVTYFDNDGTEQTLTEDTDFVTFKPHRLPGFITPVVNEFWPVVQALRIDGVTVRFVAGFADAANVPAQAKHAILMMGAHWNENREAVIAGTSAMEVPLGVRALMAQMETGFYG